MCETPGDTAGLLLHEWLSDTARLHPHRLAVVAPNGSKITFQELDHITDLLAVNIRYHGVHEDSVVAIFMDRCIELVFAYIAILKAGGVCMPMEVIISDDLLASLLEEASPVVCVTTEQFRVRVKDIGNVITIDNDSSWIKKMEEENADFSADKGGLSPTRLNEDSLAYLVYTSGTTGNPKGVVGCHRAIVHSFRWWLTTYPYGADEREACNIAFFWDFWRPLLAGKPLYIISDEDIRDPWKVTTFISIHAISRVFLTPSALELILDVVEDKLGELFTSISTIVLCGEVVTCKLLRRTVRKLPWVRVLNLYGISEAFDVACEDLTQWLADSNGLEEYTLVYCPVGSPVTDVQIYIMDENVRPMPANVLGEVCLGGPTMARGYLNNPAAEEKAFTMPAPGVGAYKKRLYRTGDRGLILPNGKLVVTGRHGRTVTITGYSVYTEEVESLMMTVSHIDACVVDAEGQGDNAMLTAYMVVSRGGGSTPMIRAALLERMPAYMVPAKLVLVDRFPTSVITGKVDVSQLRREEASKTSNYSNSTSAPAINGCADPLKANLMQVWNQLLGVHTENSEASFFDLGGNSFLVPRLLKNIEAQYGIRVPVSDFLQSPTVASLADIISTTGSCRRNAGKITPGDWQSGQIQTCGVTDLSREVKEHSVPKPQRLQEMLDGLECFRQRFMSSRHGRLVLLTGATGFLGCYLLRELLVHTELAVVCLVRGNGKDKLMRAWKNYGIFPTATDAKEFCCRDDALEERVSFLDGDIGCRHWGLCDPLYKHLALSVSCVVHCAAQVNTVYPYQMLRQTNVLGTKHVVEFCLDGKIKTLHYISTASVYRDAGRHCSTREVHVGFSWRHLSTGYAQSKWVAEQIVYDAMTAGLPAAIYRPGNISPDHQGAVVWNKRDYFYLLLSACLKMQCVPGVAAGSVEMTPVDFVSRFLVRSVTSEQETLGNVFNLVNPISIPMRHLFETLVNEDAKIKTVPAAEWMRKMESAEQLGSLVKFLFSNSDQCLTSEAATADTTNTQYMLEKNGWTYPKITSELLQRYTGTLRESR